MDRKIQFPASYAASREQFREVSKSAEWQKTVPLSASTGQGEEEQASASLTVDVAYFGPNDPQRTVMVTSGLHGVEGFFGAAVQLSLLDSWGQRATELECGLLLIHALNPYGFANLRRWNELNVDLNRNFLLPGEDYSGAQAHYSHLNELLNPKHPPRKFDGFYAQALWAVCRHGFNALQQAIAGGQYEYPQGLFFGGAEPSATYRILEEHLRSWVGDCPEIVHLDFHTGLGKWATYQLLIEESLESETGRWLQTTFTESVIRSPHNTKSAYLAKGGLGSWCKQHLADRKYIYACAEFGTYHPVKVLAGLRAENQAFWYSSPNSPEREKAAAHLKELFCPASESWQKQVVKDGIQLIETAMKAKERV